MSTTLIPTAAPPPHLAKYPTLSGFDLGLCDLHGPTVEPVPGHEAGGWWVARDDLILGGTKARVLAAVVDALGWKRGRPVAYAGPAQGGMQIALAAHATIDAHLFYGERRVKGLHPRQRQTIALGARHHYSPYPAVRPSQVKTLCRSWCIENDALNLRWGLVYWPVLSTIAGIVAGTLVTHRFDEIWVAGGSGTLATAIRLGAQLAESAHVSPCTVHVVPIGREMLPGEAPGCTIYAPPPYQMDQKVKCDLPFPCDPYYDGKAWEAAIKWCHFVDRGNGTNPSVRRLFWNVIAPAPE